MNRIKAYEIDDPRNTLYPACCYYHNICYDRIYAYLEEKGIDFGMGSFPQGTIPLERFLEPRYASEPGHSVTLIVHVIAPKFYHEVVVPGLRAVCAENHVDIVPVFYTRREDDCRLGVKLFFRPETIPMWVMEKTGY